MQALHLINKNDLSFLPRLASRIVNREKRKEI